MQKDFFDEWIRRDLDSGQRLRDAALDQVAQPPWPSRAHDAFRSLILPETFTGEDIRLHLISGGLVEPPHHHNAWGALIMRLVRCGDIEATGDFQSMREPRSHARMTRVYRRVRSHSNEK